MLLISDIFSLILIFSSVLSSYWILLQVYYFKTKKGEIVRLEKSPSEPFFSIIVAIKNEDPSIIEELIGNLLDLDYNKYEVIIVSDDSQEYVSALKSRLNCNGKDDIVKIVRRENSIGRKAGALNYGTKIAKGDYLVFLDSEARVDKDFLKRLSKHVNSSALALRIKIRDAKSAIEKIYSRMTEYSMDSLFLSRFQKGLYIFPNGSAFVISRSLLQTLGMWKEGVFTEDLEIGLRAHFHDVKIEYIDEINVALIAPKNLYDLYYQIERWSYGSGELFLEGLKLLKKGVKGLEGFMYVIQWGLYSSFLFTLILISSFQPILKISFLNYLLPIAIFACSLAIYSFTFKISEKDMHLVSFVVIWASLIGFIKGLLRLRYSWRVTPKTSSNTKKPLILTVLQYLLILLAFVNLFYNQLLSSIILLSLSVSLFMLPD